MQQRGRGGNGWIGWVIFFLLIFGSRLLPPIAGWLTQLTGFTITPPMLIVGLIALSVVGSLAGSVGRQISRARASGETRLPTPLAPPASQAPPAARPAPPRTPGSLPPTLSVDKLPPPRLPSGEQKLPSPPRFEPIIDPRVLTFGILGLLGLGAIFLVLLAIGGALP
jgi:hypothetical protein